MLSKNFLRHTVKCLKSFFGKRGRYLKILQTTPLCISRCCASMHRESKGSSRFRELLCATKPEKATKTRKQKKGGKSKVQIQTSSNPDVRNSDGKTSYIGLGSDQGGRRQEKAEVRGCVVVEKLKSMKMMEEGNPEHIMDIDETIYYYSLITSQTFQDIADKFFVDLYCGFSVSQVQAGHTKLC